VNAAAQPVQEWDAAPPQLSIIKRRRPKILGDRVAAATACADYERASRFYARGGGASAAFPLLIHIVN
jgi:hypothetical protein